MSEALDELYKTSGAAQRPDLHLVEGAKGEQLPDNTARVAEFTQAIDHELIPASVAEADEAVGAIRAYSQTVRSAVEAGTDYVEPDVAHTLYDMAERGTDIWKLSDTERRDYVAILKAKNFDQLEGDAATWLSEKTPEGFQALQAEVKARVKLDDALLDREISESLDKASASMEKAGFSLHEEPATKKPSSKVAVTATASDTPETPQRDLSDFGIKLDKNGRAHGAKGQFQKLSAANLQFMQTHKEALLADVQGSREEYEQKRTVLKAVATAQIAERSARNRFKDGLGSRAVERAGLQDKYDNEARQQLEAEGNDMSALSVDEEAATTSTWPAMPVGVKAEVWEDLDNEAKSRFVAAWEGLSDEERTEQIAAWNSVGQEQTRDFNKRVADMDKETRDKYFANVREAAELQKAEPVSDVSPQGLRARAKRLFGKASDKLTQIYATAGNRIVNPLGTANEFGLMDEEVSKERARRATIVMGVAVGALAVAKLYATMNGLHHSGGAGTSVIEHLPKHQKVEPGVTLQAKPNTFTVHEGDTFFDRGTQILHEQGVTHPTMQMRVDEMHHLMHVNHMDEDQAEHLVPGQKYKK